jgi:hypothetical protein
MKKLFKYISQIAKYILVAGIIASLAYSLGLFVINGYPKIFTPQETLVSANFTDFYLMNFKSETDCVPDDSFSSYQFDFSRIPTSILSEYKATASTPIEFSIWLPAGKLAIKKYVSGKSEYIDYFPIEPNSGFKGTIGGLEVRFDSQIVSIREEICTQELRYDPEFAILSILHDPAKYQWVYTSQYMRSNDKVMIFIDGPIHITGFPDENIDRLEFTIISDEGQHLDIKMASKGLVIDLPTTGMQQLAFTDEETITNSRLRAFPDELIIEVPEGMLKLGNEESISIGGLTKVNDEKVFFQKTTLGSSDYAVFGNIKTAEYEISGTTTGIILNNEQLVKSFWDKLPDYLKSALFGVFLAGIGAIWKFRNSIWTAMKSFVLFWRSADSKNPTKGSFVCVTNTGMMIAGDLSRKPGKNYQYYLIRNARRKFRLSDQWDTEIIPEIKIRADAVEQSYVL